MDQTALAVAGVLWVKAIVFIILYLLRGKAWVKTVFLWTVRVLVFSVVLSASVWTAHGLLPRDANIAFAKRCIVSIQKGTDGIFSVLSYSQWDKRLKKNHLAKKAAGMTSAQIVKWAKESGHSQ